VRVLSGFGLTRLQAKVYLRLMDLGQVSASELGRDLGNYRQEMYRILSKLAEMGLIQQLKGPPAKYVAKEPREALRALILSRTEELSKLQVQSESLIRLLHNKNTPTPESDKHFEVLIEPEKVLRRIIWAVTHSKKSVTIFAESEVLSLLMNRKFLDQIIEAVPSQVRLLIVTNLDPPYASNVVSFLTSFRKSTIRHTKMILSNVIIVDNKEVMISIGRIDLRNNIWVNLWTDVKDIVKSFLVHTDFAIQSSKIIGSHVLPIEGVGRDVEGALEMIRGEHDINRFLHEVVARTEKTGMAVVERGSEGLISTEFLPDHKELWERGVTLLHLMHVDEDNAQFALRISRYSEVRHTNQIGFGAWISDRDFAMGSVVRVLPGEIVWTNRWSIVSHMRLLFQKQWNDSQPLQQRLNELRIKRSVDMGQNRVLSGDSKVP
jgi:sugar-specific transcriptional regulator TrmB